MIQPKVYIMNPPSLLLNPGYYPSKRHIKNYNIIIGNTLPNKDEFINSRIIPNMNNINNYTYNIDKTTSNHQLGINIKTDEIFKEINIKEKAATAPGRLQNMNSMILAQQIKEEKYISLHPICPVSQLKNLRNHINTIDPTKFKNLINKHFYDPAVMKEAMCISNSLFYMRPLDPGSMEINDRIREWITNLKQIGQPSIEGYAISSSFTNDTISANNMFVLKAPRDPQSDNLLHEYFVGLELDKLRLYTPNFATTYGAFRGTSPVINTNKDVVSWTLKTNSPVNYILYENIQPSISMGDYVTTASFTQILDKFIQIIYALKLAHKQLDYTHYDLHAENVLIRDIEGSSIFSIPYLTENNKVEYVLTDKLAVIIDYGFSHVKVDGEHYGIFDRVYVGVNPDRSFPMYDVYKFLMWIIYKMIEGNNMEYKKFEPIFRFFNKTESLEDVINSQIKYSYSLPYNNKTKNITFDEFIKYIRNTIPEISQIIVSDKPNGRIIGCNGTDICMSQNEIVETLNLNSPITVSTVYQFYDVISRLEAENRMDEIQNVISRFDQNIAINKAYTRYNSLISQIIRNKKNIYPVRLEGIHLNMLLQSNEIYEQHMKYVITVIEIWDLFHTVLVLIDAIRYLYRWYNINSGDDQQSILENEINNILNPLINEFNMSIDEYMQIYNYINNLYINNTSIINKQLNNRNPIAIWYWVTYPSYTQILIGSQL